jgi:hypothetical protein
MSTQPKRLRERGRLSIIIALGFVLFSCGNRDSPAIQSATPTNPLPTLKPAVTKTAFPELPTSSPTVTHTPDTLSSLYLTPTPTMPAYYVPHPALRNIVPPLESSSGWHNYAIRWKDNGSVNYLVERGDYNCETHCRTEMWATYELTGVTTTFTTTQCIKLPEETVPLPDFMQRVEFGEDEIISQEISPDGTKALVLTH